MRNNGNQTISNVDLASCNQKFYECAQFQQHYNLNKGKCNCRCYAKHCKIDHFGLNSKVAGGARTSAKAKGFDSKRGKKFETQPADF